MHERKRLRGFLGPAFVAAALISGVAQADPLSDFTSIEFTADGDLTEFVSLGDGQDYIDLTVPGSRTDGDILASVTVTPGVLVVKDKQPPPNPGAGDRPTGFHDLPALDFAGPVLRAKIPSGFNIGRMFVSYNRTLDKYYVGIDCTAPSLLDNVAGTDPVAFDTDGDGEADIASELAAFGDPPLDEVPRTFQDDFYFVVFDFDSDNKSDLEVRIIERHAESFVPIPAGALVLSTIPGVSTRFVEVLPEAFQANLTAAAVGTVPGAGDIEFELSSASTLPTNANPFCMTVGAVADTFNDVGVEGAEEELDERFLVFPNPRLECAKAVRCVVDGVGVGSFRTSTQLAAGEEVEFEITLNNVGNLNLALTTTDVLSCVSPAVADLIGGTCQTPGVVPGGIISDFCDQFEVAFGGGGFPLAIGTLAGGEPDAVGCPTGPGESFTFRFQASTGPGDFCDASGDRDPDCTNTAGFLGAATVDSTPFEDEDNPHEFAVTAEGACDSDLDLVCRDVSFTKTASAENAGGALGPLELPRDDAAFPVDVTYTYTVDNDGVVDEDVTVEDAGLCNDVAATVGVSLINCPVCPSPPGSGGTAPVGGSFTTRCAIQFETAAALEAFTVQDDSRPECGDPGVGCYKNCAAAIVGASDTTICGAGAAFDATARICQIQDQRGACCDGCSGVCTNDVLENACVEPAFCQPTWTKEADCSTVECEEHTGACCQRDTPGGFCEDDVPESQCPVGDQVQWFKDTACDQSACGEHTGACCDNREAGGECTDDVPESQCPSDFQHQWYKDTACTSVTCEEHTGACCDKTEPGGLCEEDVPESQCPVGDQVQWFKDASCVGISCDEHTGACCDKSEGANGLCLDDVPESECEVSDDIQWFKDTPCNEIDCGEKIIPTVSGWGLLVIALLLGAGILIKFGRGGAAKA